MEKTSQPTQALTSESIDTFRARGFLRIGPLLDGETLSTLRDEYDRIFDEARESNQFRNLAISDTEDLDAKIDAPEQMLQIMQVCERSIAFRQLLYDARILDIAEDLIGPNIQLFHVQGLGKSHERSLESGALLDVGQRVDTSQAEVVDLPAGGALFHHCQTLHYTPPNATSRQRRALAIHLMPPGTRSGHTGATLDVSYARPMLRMRF